jgi:hypothetical protein
LRALLSAACALALASMAALSADENSFLGVGAGVPPPDAALATAGFGAAGLPDAGAALESAVSAGAEAASASIATGSTQTGAGGASPSLRTNRMEDQTS